MQHNQEPNFSDVDSHRTEYDSDDYKAQIVQWVDKMKSTDDLLKVVSELEKLPLDLRRKVLEAVVETYILHFPESSESYFSEWY
ncbi:MAG: hypothetical protein HXY43_25910 [Fischerella sp.]|jgi:hypothetical protein|uniref:hypothetical protein n=1 Tax=Fischerella sp. TaxID=1191 RepID=UPI0017F453BB|nr:hypothetical protein [Fischerella sp.]NWF62576.1 hypothetical protein [Fischerella sp.]